MANVLSEVESQTIVPKRGRREVMKALVAGSIGNMMEWYDFAVFGFFTSIISQKFFPSTDPVASLLSTFAVYAVGFLMRPLGAFVIGSYGDRVGRKNALTISVLLMAFSTFIMGILPSYDQIGVLAPVVLVIARLIQGFSVGAEWSVSATFLVEYAPEGKRGFYGSWSQVSSGSGILLGSITATLLSTLLTPEALNSWGWRVAFASGLLVGIVGLYMRLKINETPQFQLVEQSNEVSKQPMLEAIRKYPREILKVVGISMSWTVSFYITMTYLPTYMKTVIKMSFQEAMVTNIIILVFFNGILPLMGILSDRIGRKPLLITSCLGFAILSYPAFMLINHGGFVFALLPQVVLAIFLAMFSATGPAAFAEQFPTHIRNSALSVGYNIAAALFGGTAPMIATYLISATNNKLAPTFYVIVCALITLTVLIGMKDRFKEKLN
jgi:MHS family proline/betaine transporter-like MFS transporter